MKLSEITRPFKSHLDNYEKTLKEILESDIPIIDRVSRYLIKHKGKNLRPMLVILSAGLSGVPDKKTYRVAATVELLHTASLVHDDVVDDSDLRRGFPSVKAIWRNKVSVLMGDYLLAKSLIAATEIGNIEVMNLLSTAAKRLSQGELLQIQNVWRQKNSEEDYYAIISNKTAALLSVCCELGSLSVSANPEHRRALKGYGENLGMAFQIKDDLLDYQSLRSIIGKPVGNDLREKKYTLPLIYALSQAGSKEGRKIKKLMAKGPDDSEIKEIVTFAEEHGGIEYAEKRMKEFMDKSQNELDLFPDSEVKKAAGQLLDFVISRKK